MQIALKSFNSYKELTDDESLYSLFCDLFDNNIKYYKLIHRLYAKYVNKNNAIETIGILENANISKKNKILMKKIVGACKDGIEYIELSFKMFGKYEPLRLVILDEPYCTLSDNISLEDYDNNDGEPFWMRPKYILDHYSKSNKNI